MGIDVIQTNSQLMFYDIFIAFTKNEPSHLYIYHSGIHSVSKK